MSIFGGRGGVKGWKTSGFAKKSYVAAGAGGVDLTNYIKKDLNGDVDMMGGRIMNLGDIQALTDAVSARVVQSGWKSLRGEVLQKNGDTAMEGHLDLNGYRIRNLRLPYQDDDAANKYYVDERIRQISKPKPVITIWAEERGGLVDDSFEWSFGSNSEGRSHGKVGYVMMRKGRILDMSLSSSDRNGFSRTKETVAVTINGNVQAGYDITKEPRYHTALKRFQPPLELDHGDIINFKTRASSNSHASGVVTLLIELEI